MNKTSRVLMINHCMTAIARSYQEIRRRPCWSSPGSRVGLRVSCGSIY